MEDEGKEEVTMSRTFHLRPVFARPVSALRASTRRNPRTLPCPTCKRPNLMTPADLRNGYQCDQCADRDEGCF